LGSVGLQAVHYRDLELAAGGLAKYAEDRLAYCDGLPAEMFSSMYHDLEHGKRLAVDWLSGGVVELGQVVGVPTPLNRALSDILALHANGKPKA
jgi:2-dehydropantoate 2-reductase